MDSSSQDMNTVYPRCIMECMDLTLTLLFVAGKLVDLYLNVPTTIRYFWMGYHFQCCPFFWYGMHEFTSHNFQKVNVYQRS